MRCAASSRSAWRFSVPQAKPERTFGLFILLPRRLETRLKAWARATPGATWPDWRGHVTLLNAFEPTTSVRALLAPLREVCAATDPFDLTLDRVSRRRHLVRDGLETVMLIEDEPDKEGAPYTLRSAFIRRLRRLKEDGDVTRKVARRPYVPHLTLTAGLPPDDALALAQRTREDEVTAAFHVDRIHLVAFGDGLEPQASHVLWLGSARPS